LHLLVFFMKIWSSLICGGNMRISKWDNSLAIRLPATVVEALKLKEGDEIRIRVVSERCFEVERSPNRGDIIAKLSALRGSIPSDFRFDRLDANER
jgi:antitoxin MazE